MKKDLTLWYIIGIILVLIFAVYFINLSNSPLTGKAINLFGTCNNNKLCENGETITDCPNDCPYNYSDTLLVINDNSDISIAVGNYFLSSRGVAFPLSNVVHINTVTVGIVNRAEYTNNIKTPIENFIISHNLNNTINYIILTKGIPIELTDNYNSVDSELAWCLGKQICPNSINLFYNSNTTFSHKLYNMYLITRLDGYTLGDISQIKALIDHSLVSPSSYAALKSNGLFILDAPGPGSPYYGVWNSQLENAKVLLDNKGWKTNLDETNNYLYNQQNVLGYWSLGSNAGISGQEAIPGNTYLNGSIAETAVSTSARDFNPTTYGQSLIADWIAEGVAGIKGYVSEPGGSAIAKPDILFDHYTSGFNMADSFYSASIVIKWKDIIVGDPKMKISPPSTGAQIINFNSYDPWFVGTVNQTSHNLNLLVPHYIDLTKFKPWIIASLGASIYPESGVAQDFRNPVIYTVISMDKATTQTYTATIAYSDQIIYFNFTNSPVTRAEYDHTNGIINLVVPYRTNLSNLNPIIAISPGATISKSYDSHTFFPISWSVQDFTNPVWYKVTAADKITTNTYEIEIIAAEKPYNCNPNWSCTGFANSSCINNLQTQTCIDINNCGNTTDEPNLTQQCNQICTNSSWGFYLTPQVCPVNSKQNKTWINLDNCNVSINGSINHLESEIIDCSFYENNSTDDNNSNDITNPDMTMPPPVEIETPNKLNPIGLIIIYILGIAAVIVLILIIFFIIKGNNDKKN